MAIINTNLTIGIFTIPCAFNALAEKKDVELGRATLAGNKIVRKEVDEVTGAVVTREDIQKGVWREDGVFLPIPAEAISLIDAATKLDNFEVESFIPLAEVPWERTQKSYYLTVPTKGPIGPMAIFAGALRESEAAGVMKIVLRSRQQLAVVYAKNDGLWVTTLAWSEDWQRVKDADVLAGVTADPAHIGQAIKLVAAYMAEDAAEALDALTDDLRPAREALIAEAAAGKPIKATAKVKPVTDSTIDALTASIDAALARKKGKVKVA